MTKPQDDIINNVKEFDPSRMEEIEGLPKSGAFKLVNVEDITKGTGIFGSRFTDTVKNSNFGARYKGRLVAQNYGIRDAATIATKDPTMQRFSHRLLFSIAASLENMTCHIRDTT